MAGIPSQEILSGLYCFEDGCNVYVLKRGDRAIAIDFGGGRWLARLPALGIRGLDHVFLTHHHVDQCEGLLRLRRRAFKVHAPAGEAPFLDPSRVAEAREKTRRKPLPFPASYSALDRGIPGIVYDMAEARDLFWGDMRIRFFPTPGHGRGAHSVILNWGAKQAVFCGDAAHAGATIWQPYHLEWYHTRTEGSLDAWLGVWRLSHIGMDLLCPSHGPVIDWRPRAMLKRLAAKLMDFVQVKDAISEGETDEFWPVESLDGNARRVLPHLYQYGMNSYMLLSETGEALIVDPFLPNMEIMERLLARLGRPRVTAALVTHFHWDHSNGVPYLQKKHKTRAFLHPMVAEPLTGRLGRRLPYLPPNRIHADKLLPERGVWRWNEYAFDVAPFPAQTWWHAAHQTTIDGLKVFFGGDNFQPMSRWGGTGGFCSLNHSIFREGFIKSARLVQEWAPDLLCNGHGTCFRFHPSQFRKIPRWALRAEKATRALCPTGDLDKDYYLRPLRPKGRG